MTGGVHASQRLSLPGLGKTRRGKPRSEPDPGNPAVRDRRGAWGNTAYGGTGNPSCNRKGRAGNPPPKGRVRLRSIPTKWLAAGVMEGTQLSHPDAGTPQGGVVSPMLANVYLHDALDKWFERDARPRLRGRARMVRFADDRAP